MKDNLVSIITPCYNSDSFLEETILSVISQTYNNWELILVDDVSSDNTRDIIRKYSNQDTRIRYVFLQKNTGVSNARNQGILNANGRYLAFLDSDDLWMPEKLELQLSFMKKNNYIFSYTAYSLISQEGKNMSKIINAVNNLDYASYLKNTVIGCLTVMLDRNKTGNFFFPALKISEDMACWVLLMKNGSKAYALNKSLSFYRVKKNSLSSNKIEAAIYVWKVYRDVEKLSLFYSLWCFFFYAFNSILRRI